MNGGSTNLGIESLTTGVSREGLQHFFETLDTDCLRNTCKEIDNVEDVIIAINNCWQGESRDRFLRAFSDAREIIKNDLELEFSNIESKFQSLANAMYSVDHGDGIYHYYEGGE